MNLIPPSLPLSEPSSLISVFFPPLSAKLLYLTKYALLHSFGC